MAKGRLRFDIRLASGRILVVLALLFAANGAFYMLFVRPTLGGYRNLVQNTQPRFDELEARRRQVEDREAFLTALRTAEANLTRLREDILSTRSSRLVDVQLEVARLTREFHIDYESVNYSNPILTNEQLDRMEMVVPLEGGYGNLRSFLQAVESSDKFLVVERVALAQGKQGGVLLQLNITLATYFTVPPAAAGAAVRRGAQSS